MLVNFVLLPARFFGSEQSRETTFKFISVGENVLKKLTPLRRTGLVGNPPSVLGS